jgi:methyl-accepting chemotaxis protein
VHLVDNSVALAHKAGDAITNLRDMAQNVSAFVCELDPTLSEQSMASSDVAVKIEQISSQAEQTSHTANETSAAAAALNETAHRMQQVVARFQI